MALVVALVLSSRYPPAHVAHRLRLAPDDVVLRVAGDGVEGGRVAVVARRVLAVREQDLRVAVGDVAALADLARPHQGVVLEVVTRAGRAGLHEDAAARPGLGARVGDRRVLGEGDAGPGLGDVVPARERRVAGVERRVVGHQGGAAAVLEHVADHALRVAAERQAVRDGGDLVAVGEADVGRAVAVVVGPQRRFAGAERGVVVLHPVAVVVARVLQEQAAIRLLPVRRARRRGAHDVGHHRRRADGLVLGPVVRPLQHAALVDRALVAELHGRADRAARRRGEKDVDVRVAGAAREGELQRA
jgi:hypothetical protein